VSLDPNEVDVNEAWIVFQLNETPIRTEADGHFNCVVLMDAASCFILGMTMVLAGEAEPSKVAVQRLLEEAKAHKQKPADKLFVPSGQFTRIVPAEAERQGIGVVRVAETELLPMIGEARDSFKEHFGRGSV